MRLNRYVLFEVLAFACAVNVSNAQTTAFTYQGALSDENGPASGLFDMTFGLFTAETDGTAVSTVTNTSVSVSNGLFTTTLDFGAAVFDGTDYWLEIGVQSDGGDGFTTLAPRQPLNNVPYAIHARMAMDVVNPMFLGTTTDAPLEFYVNNWRALRLESGTNMMGSSLGTVNVIGGHHQNYVANGVEGATIAGGGQWSASDLAGPNIIESSFASIGGGALNRIFEDSDYSVVAGGFHNKIDSNSSVISGGLFNSIKRGWNSTIGGGVQNTIFTNAPVATISGGRFNRIYSESVEATISGGGGNTIWSGAEAATIGGGLDNFINSVALAATISGGNNNIIRMDARNATIGGGADNFIEGSLKGGNPYSSATIGGGENNRVLTNAQNATISGGNQNTIRADAQKATISGGFQNTIGTEAQNATIGGGRENLLANIGDTIGGGSRNVIEPGSLQGDDFNGHHTIAGGLFNVIETDAEIATIGGGDGNRIELQASLATIAGGIGNVIMKSSGVATIGGGDSNKVQTNAPYAMIGGGKENSIGPDTPYVSILGGNRNAAKTYASTIGGGENNIIEEAGAGGNDPFAGTSTISGGWNNLIESNLGGATIGGGIDNSILGDTNETFYGHIGGGANNKIHAHSDCATISGGCGNTIGTDAQNATIGGGRLNSIEPSASDSTIAGGFQNRIGTNVASSVISGGLQNAIDGSLWSSIICGGEDNAIGRESETSTIVGGAFNRILSGTGGAVIGGGWSNTNSGRYAVIPGGNQNAAVGEYSFAFGRRAKALHDGSFVWGDATNADIESSAMDEVTFRASGGFRILTDSGLTAGVSVPAGGTGWDVISDRNMKENFEPLDGKEVLEQVAAMPISRWNMKSQDPSICHIGPMAQDFHAAFGLGESDRRINTVDADGVALAAIQGLNQKLEEKDLEIQELRATVSEMKILMEQMARRLDD